MTPLQDVKLLIFQLQLLVAIVCLETLGWVMGRFNTADLPIRLRASRVAHIVGAGTGLSWSSSSFPCGGCSHGSVFSAFPRRMYN